MSYEERELKQKLSMLMDSELHERDCPDMIRLMGDDEDLKTTWGRYHLIGEVMRHGVTALADEGLARRVGAAVSAEQATVLAFPVKRANKRSWRNRAVTLALAASLASVAVLVGRSVHDNAQDLAPMAARSGAVERLADRQELFDQDTLVEAQFNDYLLTHNETAAMAGAAGMFPHVRLVSVRSDR